MKFVCISDTHNNKINLINYSADCIIHCGDATLRGTFPELNAFLEWYGSLPYEFKILVPGNHDFIFEKEPALAKNLCEENNIILLIDKVLYLPTEINEVKKSFTPDSPLGGGRIKLWGSPYLSDCPGWAFFEQSNKIQRHWDLIPENLDILITHCPAHDTGLGNLKNSNGTMGQDLGCPRLKKVIFDMKPRFHIHGHIHEGYGVYKGVNTTYINCSILDEKYFVTNKPVTFTYPPKSS